MEVVFFLFFWKLNGWTDGRRCPVAVISYSHLVGPAEPGPSVAESRPDAQCLSKHGIRHLLAAVDTGLSTISPRVIGYDAAIPTSMADPE